MANEHIFLSYSNLDQSFVGNLRADLAKVNLPVWIDREGLVAGTPDWDKALRYAIRNAFAFVLVASPSSYESRYVQGELEVARMYRCPVFPVWADGENWGDCVPLDLLRTQYVNMRGSNYYMGFELLVPELKKRAVSGAVTELSTGVIAQEVIPLGFTPRNPYKGLYAFTEKDKNDYYGRETLVQELVEQLRNSNFISLVGPSGSGKSSVIMAGLLPQLRSGAVQDSTGWVYVDPVLPGADPVEALAIALAGVLGISVGSVLDDLDRSNKGLHITLRRLVKRRNSKVVLFVDQFEEIFTQTTDEDKRKHFIDLLVNAVDDVASQIILLMTLRADFYDKPMNYGRFGKLIELHSKSLLPMTIEELRTVILSPAQKPDVQLSFGSTLVGDILYDLRDESGALPLLQFVLDQLFIHRQGQTLSVDAYRRTGGLKGALANHAEKTYAQLPSDTYRSVAKSLFLKLIEPGVTEKDVTRRRANLSELELTDREQTQILSLVVQTFVVARLLSVSEKTIEISHEALIREWPRLTEWVRISREGIRIYNSLSTDVNEWLRRDKSEDILYRGKRLKEIREWMHENTVSSVANEFIEESISREHEEISAVENYEQTSRQLSLLINSILASLPHEFRTPLNVILGFSNLLSSDVDSMSKEQVGSIVSHIQSAGERLYKLTEKYISYAYAMTMKYDPKRREQQVILTSPCLGWLNILLEASSSIASLYNRESDLFVETASSTAPNLHDDFYRMIVSEILDNAFKFSIAGNRVEINVSDNQGNYCLTIKDFGRGMSEDEIASIGPFVQFERRIHEQQGIGLGLTLVSEYVTLFGGSLKITSEKGKWTSIDVRLPATNAVTSP